MNSNEFLTSGIIESYVLGLCSAQEKAEVENMRSSHPEVNAAIIKFEDELELQFMANASPTSAELDNNILTSILQNSTKVETTAPVINMNATPKRKSFSLAAAAMAGLLLGSLAFNFILAGKNKKQQEIINASKTNEKPNSSSLPEKDFSILTNQSITPVAMYGVGTHGICRCTLYWDKATGKAYVMIHHLAKTPEGRNYQLWANVNGKNVNVGLVDESIRNRFIEVSNVPEGSAAFTITLEKEGGSQTPTLEQAYVAGKIA